MPRKTAKKRAATDEALISTALVRMRTTRQEWKKDQEKPELSPRVTQAILALIGVMPSKSELRYSADSGFDMKVAGGRRYKPMSPLDYAFQLIECGTNPSNSAWGAEIHCLPDKADREDLFVRKMRDLLGKCDGFKDIYAALKTMIPEAEWVGALDWPEVETESDEDSSCEDKDECPSTKPNEEIAADLPEEPKRGAPEEPKQLPADAPVEPQQPPADAPVEPQQPPADAPVESGSTGSASSDEESEAHVSSSSGDSSSESGDSSSDADAPLDQRKRRRVTPAAEPASAPAAESTGESWLTAIADHVKAARGKGPTQLLQEFRDKYVPKTSSGLQTSRKVERPTKLVPALRSTCAFAEEIIRAKLADPPVGARRFLRGGDLCRDLNPQQVEIFKQCLALINSNVTLGRVVIGAGVGAGKTSAALALCCALFRGAVEGMDVSSVVVFAPGHLVSQWVDECGKTLNRAQVYTIPQDLPLNEQSLKEVLNAFYAAVYEVRQRPGEVISMPILILPIHVFNFPNLVSLLLAFRMMLNFVMLLDEPHLTCKRNDGACGSEVADLMQHTAAHGVRSVVIYVTATPLCKGKEALPWLMSMGGLLDALPQEVFQIDAVAQCVFDAIMVRPPLLQPSPVPKYSLYKVLTPKPKSVDYSVHRSRVARQLRAGNGTKLADNYVLHAALLAALCEQSAGRSSLIFFDVKKGVQELREIVQWPSFYFLEGDTPASERERIMKAVKEAAGGVVLVTTIAMCAVGTNLGDVFQYVYFCGAMFFDSEGIRQAIGRAARPPSQRAVTSIMFMSPDEYSSCTEGLRKRKRIQMAPFLGTEVRAEDVQGSDDCAGCALLDMADLPSIIAGLDALTQDELAIHPNGKCFEVSYESQLQPPPRTKQLRSELEKIQASLQQAIEDQADPEAASARRAEKRRRFLESLVPAQVDPAPLPVGSPPVQQPPIHAALQPPIHDGQQPSPPETEESLYQLEQEAKDAEENLKQCRQRLEQLEQARRAEGILQQQLEELERNAAQAAEATKNNPFQDFSFLCLAELAPAPP